MKHTREQIERVIHDLLRVFDDVDLLYEVVQVPVPLEPGEWEKAVQRELCTLSGIRIECLGEDLATNGEPSPLAALVLGVMGALRDFDRARIKVRQREGIEKAKLRGVYKGRKKSLSPPEVEALRRRIEAGASKAQVAREFGITRQTLYQYLRGTHQSNHQQKSLF